MPTSIELFLFNCVVALDRWAFVCYIVITMSEKFETPQKSKVQESTQNIEDDFSDMMPTAEEFYADMTPEPYEPNCYDGTYSEV